MSTPTFYTFIGSGNSYKVRLLESILGFKLNHEELDFLVSCIIHRHFRALLIRPRRTSSILPSS